MMAPAEDKNKKHLGKPILVVLTSCYGPGTNSPSSTFCCNNNERQQWVTKLCQRWKLEIFYQQFDTLEAISTRQIPDEAKSWKWQWKTNALQCEIE